jgi:hypothetical protein
MKPIYGSPLVGVFTRLTILTASMAVKEGYFQRGARIYLVNPEQIDSRSEASTSHQPVFRFLCGLLAESMDSTASSLIASMSNTPDLSCSM